MRTIVLLLTALMAGCSTMGSAAGSAVDELRDSAEFTLCRAISVGSWYRSYGTDGDRLQAWLTICKPHLQ